MHRTRGPLIITVALLLFVAPVFGRVTQTDPNDPYQISTPSAWERSQGLSENQPVVEFEFLHGVQFDENQRAPVEQLQDQILLFGEDRVSGLDRETLILKWDTQLPTWIDHAQRSSVLHGLIGEDSRHVIVGNSYTHSMINIETGEIVWTQEKTYPEPSLGVSMIGEQFLLHEQENSYGDRLFEVIDAQTGEFLAQIFSSGYPETRAYENYFVAEAQDHLFAASPDTDEMHWVYYLRDSGSYVYLLQEVILVLNNEEIIGIDPATGHEIWLLYVPSGDYSLAETSESVALLRYEQMIISIDLQTGLQLQSFPVTSEGGWWPTLRNNRFINLDERGVTLVDAITSEEIWRLNGAAEWFEPFMQDEYTIIVQTSAGQFAILDSATLDLKWSGQGFVQEHSETSLLRVDNETDEVALLDISTGAEIWAYTFSHSETEVYAGYGYVVLTSPSTITWLEELTGEIVQQVDRSPEWAELRPAGRVFFVSDETSITLHDPLSGQSWELQDATYQGNLGWGSAGDYLFISFSEPDEKRRFWLFHLDTGEATWTNVQADDWTYVYSEEDGIVFTHDDGVVRRLNPDGTQDWETPINKEITSLTRRAEQGKLVIHFEWGIQVLDEATGETVLTTDTFNDPGMNTTPIYYASVQVAPGRIFEPGMTVSRVYRTADALPEVLAEDTVLRGAPNTEAVERGTFAAGTEVTRTGNERSGTDGPWLEVSIEGTTGWVPREALIEQQPLTDATPAP